MGVEPTTTQLQARPPLEHREPNQHSHPYPQPIIHHWFILLAWLFFFSRRRMKCHILTLSHTQFNVLGRSHWRHWRETGGDFWWKWCLLCYKACLLPVLGAGGALTLLTCHEESIDSCSSLKALIEILRRARISVAADFWRTRQQQGRGGVSHDTWDHSGIPSNDEMMSISA